MEGGGEERGSEGKGKGVGWKGKGRLNLLEIVSLIDQQRRQQNKRLL